MALRSGLASQLGAKFETTWATAVTVDHFYEHTEVGVQLQQENVQSAALRAGNRVPRTDRRFANKTGVNGGITVPLFMKGMGLWWKQILGAAAITTPTGATATRRHTHTIGDPFGVGLTIQAGIPDVAGTVQPFTWWGCKVSEFELSQSIDEFASLAMTIDGYDETTATGLASASYPVANGIFDYEMCGVTINSAAFHPTSFSIQGNMGLNTERRFIRSDSRKKEQIPAGLVEITGTITGEWEALTNYNLFVNETVVPIVFTWTGAANGIETNFPYKTTVTLNDCLITGETPAVSGPEIVEATYGFQMLYDGTDEPISVVVDTTDTSS